ncbi:MAG: multidrug ABC transporter ATP-binding protein [Sphingomonas sp. 28-66-16]|nr:MAG: multidrug ABC transporter ATP-binding protein [Sphingomonas sp. 28-66-16]
MTMPAEAIGVTKRFVAADPPALDDVSITVGPGQVTGLVGPDGAGKTTLIRILAGLLEPDSGAVTALGAAPGVRAEDIGYMPQRFGLYEDLSVRQNLRLYAELRGLPARDHDATFARLLEFTDLARFETRLAGKLSGGMKQKLGLACALVRTPRLLLLDEPGVGVDPVSRRELWAMVGALVDQGIGVLWSTAYLDEAEKCAEVYLLNEGKLLFSGPPAELTERMAGRSFRLGGITANRRALLERALDLPAVSDGMIQGRALRLIARAGATIALDDLGAGPAATLAPTPARFEDGFVDILGGGPGGTSALAASYAQVPPSDAPAIEAHGLTKRFGDFTAAENISLRVSRGEIFGLLGPNGAGKSTTFKMLCGLLTPTQGSGTVAGVSFAGSGAAARAQLGYMAQKFSLYGDLSVAQNLNFFAGVYGLGRSRARARIAELVDIFGLGRYLPVNAGTLPLGYKQRLALACAVMHEPPVLFLDEPTSGVDPITRREFWTHINGLVERGVSVLVTTHFMDEAEYCDRIALIYRAREIATGTPDDLKAQASAAAGIDDPTMEDAFIALLEDADRQRERQAA